MFIQLYFVDQVMHIVGVTMIMDNVEAVTQALVAWQSFLAQDKLILIITIDLIYNK